MWQPFQTQACLLRQIPPESRSRTVRSNGSVETSLLQPSFNLSQLTVLQARFCSNVPVCSVMPKCWCPWNAIVRSGTREMITAQMAYSMLLWMRIDHFYLEHVAAQGSREHVHSCCYFGQNKRHWDLRERTLTCSELSMRCTSVRTLQRSLNFGNRPCIVVTHFSVIGHFVCVL